MLALQTDHPRLPGHERSTGTQAFLLPASTLSKARHVAATVGCDLVDVIATALHTVLFRYTRSDEIAVLVLPKGVTRTHPAAEQTFHELLAQVKTDAVAGSSDDALQVALTELPRSEGAFAGLDGVDAHELFVAFTASDKEASCQVSYDSKLFDAATIDRLCGHLVTLLHHGASAPETHLCDLKLLRDDEWQQQLVAWNQTDAVTRGGPWHAYFEECAARAPNAIAVTFARVQLTYGELNERANRLAHYLLHHGVRSEQRVGVCVERSFDLLVALLAVSKVGAAYVPMDPGFPSERLRFMLEDSQAVFVLTGGDVPSFAGTDAHVCSMSEIAVELQTLPQTNPAVPVSDASLVYVIYTSGSTGKPKGVQVTHAALTNLLESMIQTLGVGSADVLLAVTTISFDIAALELYMPLMCGAHVVVAAHADTFDPAALSRLLEQHAVTIMQATPTTWRMLLDSNWVGRGSLRIVCGGEALPRTLADRLLPKCKELWNVYGPTETTVWSTACRVSADAGPIVIGRPLANTQLFVLDDSLQPVPIGVAGELYIGGKGLARGYNNRFKLTSERFIINPLQPERGRIYKTGDLARYRTDGSVEHLGRNDFQVKVRGFRIELAEIEFHLEAHSAVRAAVVVAQRENDGEARLVAYVVPHDMSIADSLPVKLREVLAAKLPIYMRPSFITTLASLPLTANGKIDRNALPRVEHAPEGAVAARVNPPVGKLEELLTQIWVKELRHAMISRNDNFFELGGDSLNAARIVNAVGGTLGIVAHVTAIVDAMTVEAFAAYLVKNYPKETAAFINADVAPKTTSIEIGDEVVASARDVVRTHLPAHQAPVPTKSAAPVLFVLSAARSGSTLFRVMLAGHSKLFAPPQLELLYFADLAQWANTWSGRNSAFRDGLVRALRQSRGLGLDAAQRLAEHWTAEHLSISETYSRIHEGISDRRIVDKTTGYALDLATLQRAEMSFEDARYIHLTRHPVASIHSFVEARIDLAQMLYEMPYDIHTTAELQWLISNENIVEFLRGVPPQRQMRLQFESLVEDPAVVMRDVCQRMGLDFEASVVQPYQGLEDKMVTGAHADTASRMVGDMKFISYSDINPEIGAAKVRSLASWRLSPRTTALAEKLGYGAGRYR